MAEEIHEVVKHWQRVQDIVRGYREAQVLISATQLGIFRQLADGPLTLEELARRVDANRDGLHRLLEAVVRMDLLREEGARYANTPMATACLAHEGRFYLGNLISREGAFYRRWGYLAQAVRTGQPAAESNPSDDDAPWVRAFQLALLDLARVSAPAIAELLPVPEEAPVRVLDVGGGHGEYSMALARRYLNVQATVLELPAAAVLAEELIDEKGMSDRVSVKSVDFQQEELGSDYHLVLLFGVLGSESPQGKRALLRKAHAALTPGGVVAIRGFAHGEEPHGLEEALFSLHLLLSTTEGDSPKLEELQDALRDTGFTDLRVVPVEEWIGSRLLLATKAG